MGGSINLFGGKSTGGKKMNEKILGFRKRDAQALGLRLVFDVDDIVPVVSIEWLEEQCKKNDWATANYALNALLSAVLFKKY